MVLTCVSLIACDVEHLLIVLLLSLWLLLSLLLVASFLLNILSLWCIRAQSGLFSVPGLNHPAFWFIFPLTPTFIALVRASPINSGFVYPTVSSLSTRMSNRYPKLCSALPLHPTSATNTHFVYSLSHLKQWQFYYSSWLVPKHCPHLRLTSFFHFLHLIHQEILLYLF